MATSTSPPSRFPCTRDRSSDDANVRPARPMKSRKHRLIPIDLRVFPSHLRNTSFLRRTARQGIKNAITYLTSSLCSFLKPKNQTRKPRKTQNEKESTTGKRGGGDWTKRSAPSRADLASRKGTSGAPKWIDLKPSLPRTNFIAELGRHERPRWSGDGK